ncbi:hypothetical protein CROQUDRAFT_96142 [Cronartium quercuum f. sp. fusiforme G11]|uniref:Uncharacterized protein n=1 Tax=Cronartium quercuum f. sp. fusiforme G11 TaxID=708437 RepID=A0A9P6NH85_9BASI|nr:hypothetical protein CROQUDRAFT_96142 [Cronartium quercuum f. sp. fusiforme G11]
MPSSILNKFTMAEAISLSQGHIPREPLVTMKFRTRCGITLMLMIPKPGNPDYTIAGSYRPIAFLNTTKTILEKIMASFMSSQAERHSRWRAGKLITAIFSDDTLLSPWDTTRPSSTPVLESDYVTLL